MEQAMVKDLVFDVMNLFFFPGSIQFLLCYFISLIITLHYAQCLALNCGPMKQESTMLHWRVAVIINATHNFLSRQSSTFIW